MTHCLLRSLPHHGYNDHEDGDDEDDDDDDHDGDHNHDDDDDNEDDRDDDDDDDDNDLKTGGVFWFPAVHQEAENPRTSQHLILG